MKPEFWADEKLGPLDPMTRLVFLGLISQADDAGRLVDSVRLLDGLLFPFTDDSCEGPLRTLADLEVIRRGTTASGQRVIQLVNWRHQKIDKPNLSSALPEIATQGGERPETSLAEPFDETSAKDRRNVADMSAPHISTGISTSDLRPTTSEPPREPTADDSWRSHRDECLAFVKERGYGRTEQMLAGGEDKAAWQDPKTGKQVPWPDRLALLRLADARVQDGKSPTLRSGLNYVRPQQLDPAQSPTAADFAARKQDAAPQPQVGTPDIDATRKRDDKRASESARYTKWKDAVAALFNEEPDDVRKQMAQEAKDVIGETALRFLPENVRAKSIGAKVLELYGARIGNPQPEIAA